MQIKFFTYLSRLHDKKCIKQIPKLSTITLSMILVACGGAKKPDATINESEQVDFVKDVTTTQSKVDNENPDIVIATDPSNAPFEMTGKAGNIIGLDADIINAIAIDQNFTYSFKPRKWQGIFEEIDSDSSDIISGLVTISDERLEKYDFTDTLYFKKRYAYMKEKIAGDNKITQFSDICTLSVAVKQQTDKSKLYDSICGEDNPNKVPLSSSYTAFEKMASGKVDVAIADDVLFNYLIKDNGVTGLAKIPEPPTDKAKVAWPVKKGNTEVLKKFNAGLKNIKASGDYEKLVYKWLGEGIEIEK